MSGGITIPTEAPAVQVSSQDQGNLDAAQANADRNFARSLALNILNENASSKKSDQKSQHDLTMAFLQMDNQSAAKV